MHPGFCATFSCQKSSVFSNLEQFLLFHELNIFFLGESARFSQFGLYSFYKNIAEITLWFFSVSYQEAQHVDFSYDCGVNFLLLGSEGVFQGFCLLNLINKKS